MGNLPATSRRRQIFARGVKRIRNANSPEGATEKYCLWFNFFCPRRGWLRLSIKPLAPAVDNWLSPCGTKLFQL